MATLVLLGVLLPMLEAIPGASPADAQEAAGTPVFEIIGQWINPPPTISRGNPVVAEWRVNVNDSVEPPSNAPVDNVTVDFNLTNAFFAEIPDLCLTDGVDPPSIISTDGRVLTCNFGTVNMGTALVVQTPVVADGVTGDFVTHDGTIDGQTVELPPIEILNPFVLDIFYGPNSNNRGSWNDDFTEVQVDIQWSLRLGLGSDPGPDEVSYVLDVSEVGGANVNVGTHPISGLVGCSPFDRFSADGHPWSGLDSPANQHRITSFVDTCTLTERTAQPGVFDLTLSGINYSLLDVPTHDAARGGGNPLPTNFSYIASGSLWFSVDTDEPGSIQLASNAPTYTAPTGQTFTDPAANNTTNKSYTLPGSWSAAWERAYTQSGGTPWDDSYRVSPGTSVRQVVTNRFSGDTAAPNALYGNCLVFDTAFVTLASFENTPDGVAVWAGNSTNPPPVSSIVEPPGPLQYYVGPAPADPDQFNCGADADNWTTTPADLVAVKAVRMTYPFSQFAEYGAEWFQIRAVTTINADVEIGQDVWMFGSALAGTRMDGSWFGPENPNVITVTPDARYPHTNGRRDIVRIIGAEPFIEKEAAQATVTPGVPAEFTLTYSATGAGIIPEFVDGYQIVDTLPVGMTYEPGSADPEPEVTTSGDQQVLTWTIDGVATNVEHELTYEATADASVEPGTTLTNTAVSSVGGLTADPVDATVTTTTNGYTIIMKTADVDFIPNDAGDGVGTGSWTVVIESFDPLPQEFTDTIDILPYNGDGRGTAFTGTYTLDDVVVPDGTTVYYTEADPTTLTDDPADPSNGAAGDPEGNDVGWTTEQPENPTAIRVIGPELPPGGEFSYQLVITTDGAEPGNVYWNRAQARAGHTELVMRTSAALVVTDYEVVKTSDPPSGSRVDPGDVVTYTITVTQVGDVPAGAVLTDDLSEVLDDAIYNRDVAADLGTVTVDGDVLSWEGVIPVGGVATITYSVTVKDREALEAEGDSELTNVVTSPGCGLPANCTTTLSAEPEPPAVSGTLARTGTSLGFLLLVAGALLLVGHIMICLARRISRELVQPRFPVYAVAWPAGGPAVASVWRGRRRRAWRHLSRASPLLPRGDRPGMLPRHRAWQAGSTWVTIRSRCWLVRGMAAVRGRIRPFNPSPILKSYWLSPLPGGRSPTGEAAPATR